MAECEVGVATERLYLLLADVNGLPKDAEVV